MRHAMMSLLVAALVAGLATSPAAAEAPTSLVVQTVAEPPGLDLTATPASATAAVVFYNVQEALVKVDRTASSSRGSPSGGTRRTTGTTRSSSSAASTFTTGASSWRPTSSTSSSAR